MHKVLLSLKDIIFSHSQTDLQTIMYHAEVFNPSLTTS